MDRAAGRSRDARRPAQTPERGGQWQQDRVVRRLLLPGRRAVRTRRAAAPGGTGCVADPVCGVRRRRREAPLALEGRRALPAPARIAHRSDARASVSRHPTPHKPIRGIRARKLPRLRLRFCIASSPRFRKRDPQSRIANDCFFFSAARSVVIMASTKSRDFFFVKFRWFIIEPNRYKTAAGSPKTRVTSPTGFFVFSPSRPRRRTETQRNTYCFPRKY